MNTTSPPHIIIVGAGIVGLGHAVAALDAGFRVTVLEQDAAAVLASVRNFGHVGASVQAGEFAELAEASLPIWHSLVARAGVQARESGTLVVARSQLELAVLEESTRERSPREGQLLSAREVQKLLRTDGLERGSDPGRKLLGGMLLPRDITANPRTTVSKIAAWVGQHEHGQVLFRTTVAQLRRGRDAQVEVVTNQGMLAADHVIVATGHLLGRLFPEIASRRKVQECVLQMFRVEAPRGLSDLPAVLSGTSMLRYGLFAGKAAEALRSHLLSERPELLEIDANVMLTQQADGTLLVGDSHESFDSAPPFMRESWSATLLAEAAALLGVERLEVLERWQGIYATSTLQQLIHERPLPGVHVVTVSTGTGMTIGLGLGARTIAEISAA